MARNNRHNAAFVVGSVLGAVAGAAVALWKTPYTGEELRSKLTGAGAHEGAEAQTYAAPASTGTTVGEERSIKDKVLSGVEKTLAPIVGVELGKTANGSGTTTMDSGDMKVSPEYGTTLLRHPHSWKDGEETAAPGAESGTGTLGLSRDRVDAEKWAQAYGSGADAPSTTPSAPAPEPKKTEDVSSEYGTTLLRHPHAWKDGEETATTGEAADTKLGLSRDKVDAEKWAKAYGSGAPAPDTQATQVSQPAAGTTDTTTSSTTVTGSGTGAVAGETGVSREAVETGQERLTGTRSRINADSWAAAYGTTPAASTETRYESKEAESAAQTGLGAKPAYPDSDQTGHEPVDRTAPDSNVADVERGADEIRTDSGLTVEDAASVDDLTTPRVERVPDSMREHDEGGYHPFPKLGGKES